MITYDTAAALRLLRLETVKVHARPFRADMKASAHELIDALALTFKDVMAFDVRLEDGTLWLTPEFRDVSVAIRFNGTRWMLASERGLRDAAEIAELKFEPTDKKWFVYEAAPNGERRMKCGLVYLTERVLKRIAADQAEEDS